MNIFDIILLVIVLIFVWKGFRAGLVGAIGGFVGIIIGIWAGSHYMQLVGEWIMKIADFDNVELANIIAYGAIFVGVNIAVGLIVGIINKIFHIIPFIDLVNKMLGAIVGLIGGALAAAAVVYLMSIFPISETIGENITNSKIAPRAMNIAAVVKPLIPGAIKEVKSILEDVD
ncbi:CvpA family protein [Candidatus Parcubacteria bacterium]|nr:MAG: CvpA family protein [Candidatus Parcubacteria bacterium]